MDLAFDYLSALAFFPSAAEEAMAIKAGGFYIEGDGFYIKGGGFYNYGLFLAKARSAVERD